MWVVESINLVVSVPSETVSKVLVEGEELLVVPIMAPVVVEIWVAEVVSVWPMTEEYFGAAAAVVCLARALVVVSVNWVYLVLRSVSLWCSSLGDVVMSFTVPRVVDIEL